MDIEKIKYQLTAKGKTYLSGYKGRFKGEFTWKGSILTFIKMGQNHTRTINEIERFTDWTSKKGALHMSRAAKTLAIKGLRRYEKEGYIKRV